MVPSDMEPRGRQLPIDRNAVPPTTETKNHKKRLYFMGADVTFPLFWMHYVKVGPQRNTVSKLTDIRTSRSRKYKMASLQL